MIYRPDEYKHNNPDNSFVDSDFVRGGGRLADTIADLYTLTPKIDQLKENITIVYVISEDKEYRLIDITNIDNDSGWRAIDGVSVVSLANIILNAPSKIVLEQDDVVSIVDSIDNELKKTTLFNIEEFLISEGFELVDNKVDAFQLTPDNIKYPTEKLVKDSLDLKQDLIPAGTTSQYYRGDKVWINLTKTSVGLANVDNTSDSLKPVSTATQTALNLKQSTSEKNQANGYVGLDSGGKILSSFLPSFIDTIIEYPNLAAFPVTGVGSTIYVAQDTGKQYRWSGTIYSEITSGSVTSVNGKTGVVVLSKGDIGLGNVDNTTDLNKPISTATQTALNGKVNTSITISGGNGLTGGGALSTNQTLNVASANDGIIVNTDNIQLDSVDNLLSTSVTKPLSANQGRILAGMVNGVTTTLDGLSDVTAPTPTKNDVIKWNGTNWVNCSVNTTFTFGITSYTCNSGSSETIFPIGTGVWKAIGALSFSASYINGPATSGVVSKSGMTNLTLTNTFQGPTITTQAINYPSVNGTTVFTLSAANGSETATSSITYTFNNYRRWGKSTKNSGFIASDITGLASSDLVNSKAGSFTVTAGVGEYIILAIPTRLGVPTMTVGGLQYAVDKSGPISITTNGFSENYDIWVSTNPNLGNTTIIAT